jgi:hypothetical protein
MRVRDPERVDTHHQYTGKAASGMTTLRKETLLTGELDPSCVNHHCAEPIYQDVNVPLFLDRCRNVQVNLMGELIG